MPPAADVPAVLPWGRQMKAKAIISWLRDLFRLNRCLNCRKPIGKDEHFCSEICERYYPVNQIYK
jgi:Uncharacterized protein containing a Zn-ribbon (DUF2116)